jgi:predicted nucleic-acid-binding protein
MSIYLLDANVLLRFLTQDHPVHSQAATALFEQAQKKEAALEIDPLILAEVIYTLEGYYQKTRADIASVLLRLISSPGIEAERRPVILDALRRYQNFPVDFADAWLAALAVAKKMAAASFDRDLDKFTDVTRFEPQG